VFPILSTTETVFASVRKRSANKNVIISNYTGGRLMIYDVYIYGRSYQSLLRRPHFLVSPDYGGTTSPDYPSIEFELLIRFSWSPTDAFIPRFQIRIYSNGYYFRYFRNDRKKYYLHTFSYYYRYAYRITRTCSTIVKRIFSFFRGAVLQNLIIGITRKRVILRGLSFR